ncbi:MAG: putative signal transduction histidine kinase, with phosphoacceptor and binding domain [Nitrososphaera sp.]|nr:putative signal transduction histidine kinase, with phosphoacceptor and binding domain [Nitrososphaera sp.]
MQFPPEPETTEIIRGAEDTTRAVVLFFKNANRVSVCGDSLAPSVAMEVEPIKECYENLKSRKIKVRWITEITKDNLPYCKDLMRYAELRHLDGIKGNFGVNDTAYIATATLNKAQPVPELIYSTATSVIEQNKNVFDTLWSKAVLAEDRIREIEEGVTRSEIRAVKNPQEILQYTVGLVRRSKQYSVCSVSDGLLYAHDYSFDALKEILDLHRTGKHAGVRWVTKIEYNKDSKLLEVIKTFMKLGMEIRHVSNVPPMSFGVSEKEMGVTVENIRDGSLNANAIFSNEPTIVEQFAAIFEELWNGGIDAKERIDEIESQTNTFIDIIQNPAEIQKRYHALVASARQQILLFLPTTTAYIREEKIGIFESLEHAAARGASIRILLPTDKELEQKIEQKIKLKKTFEIRKIKTAVTAEARSKILVVDNSTYLMVELKDNSKESFVEAVGSAIISNSKSTVLSYITMFDSLWRQAELYEKLEAHDRMQKEFINIAAHELRTPTQAILGYSELLESVSGEYAPDMLKSLTRNAYRLQSLITDILDVARIESGSLIMEKEKLNLTDLITLAIEDAKNQVKVSGKKIEISYFHKQMQEAQQENKDLIVEADKDRTLQVLSNLLSNALKFTKIGSIEVTTEKVEKEVIVKVKDSGSGIDREIFPKLFEKFASKSEKGTGLGLFISKNITEAHGGRIWAENNAEGLGATFAFSLPVAANDYRDIYASDGL